MFKPFILNVWIRLPRDQTPYQILAQSNNPRRVMAIYTLKLWSRPPSQIWRAADFHNSAWPSGHIMHTWCTRLSTQISAQSATLGWVIDYWPKFTRQLSVGFIILISYSSEGGGRTAPNFGRMVNHRYSQCRKKFPVRSSSSSSSIFLKWPE